MAAETAAAAVIVVVVVVVVGNVFKTREVETATDGDVTIADVAVAREEVATEEANVDGPIVWHSSTLLLLPNLAGDGVIDMAATASDSLAALKVLTTAFNSGGGG